jgi:hypothetical protein
MKTPNTHIDLDIPQGLCAGKQSMHLDRFGPPSDAVTTPVVCQNPVRAENGAILFRHGLNRKPALDQELL